MIFLLKLILIAVLITYIGKMSPSLKLSNGSMKKYMTNKYAVFLVILIFTFFGAIRSNVGDTSAYMNSFNNYTISFKDAFQFNGLFKFIFDGLIKKIWNDPQILVIATSIIIYPCIIWRMYKETEDAVMSIILFVLSICFINSMNGIRQYLVSAILFFVYPWILKQKGYLWILLIIFLSLFHSTVLIMIPIILVSKMNPWSPKMIFLFLLIGVLFLTFSNIAPTLFSMLEEGGSKYAEYETANYGQVSVNIFRILFSFLPILLAFITRKSKELQTKEIYYLVNMSIFYFIFMLFGYYGANYARFCLYFELYPLLLLPALTKCGFTKNSQIIVKFGLYTLYFLFFYYQIIITWGGFILKSNWLGIVFGG